VTLPYRKELVQGWFDRGQLPRVSTFDRFIYTWIALNAALSARFAMILGDTDKVVELAEELRPHRRRWLERDPELREAAHELEAQSPILDERPRRDGRPRSRRVVAGDPRSVLLGVYAVRNNLFHGAKYFDSTRDHVLVRASTAIVVRVFHNSGLYEMAR
jgi:hypothetical protein